MKIKWFTKNPGVKAVVEENFFTVNGSALVGRAHKLDALKPTAGKVAEVHTTWKIQRYNDIPETTEDRIWNVYIVQNAGSMRTVAGYSKWGLRIELQDPNFCTCHPREKGKNSPWKCAYCLARQH